LSDIQQALAIFLNESPRSVWLSDDPEKMKTWGQPPALRIKINKRGG